MKLSDYIAIFAVIIVAILILVLTQLFIIKGTLGETCERVDHISNYLPRLGIMVANEELRKEIEGALLTTKPAEVSPGNWVIEVHVFDINTGTRTSFGIEMDDPEDIRYLALISGIARISVEDTDLWSFHELNRFSREVEEPLMLPAYLDDNTSFIFRESPENLIERLRIISASPEIFSMPSRLDTLKKLIKEIIENPDTYKVKEEIK